MRYTVVVTPEDGRFVVRVPALPGCFSQGWTVDQAPARAQEAIAGHLAALRDPGESVPIADRPPLIASVEIEPAA